MTKDLIHGFVLGVIASLLIFNLMGAGKTGRYIGVDGGACWIVDTTTGTAQYNLWSQPNPKNIIPFVSQDH